MKRSKIHCLSSSNVRSKVVLYRDTVSVEPGSRPFFGSGSVSKDTFMGVVGGKDTFSYTNDTFDVSTDLETGSVSVSKDTFMGIEHNLAFS